MTPSNVQAERFERFRSLHERPGAFVMPNAWDGASAVVLQQAGFEALGTSSLAIAFGMGRQDGAASVSREAALANGVLLGDLTGLPVNGDLEDGFGPSPRHCIETVQAAIDAGLAGLGIEDTTADPNHPIHEFEQAVARIAAAARVAKGRILLTGRTDIFLHGRPDLDEAIRRLTAFAEAGADVLYAPGLPDLAAIEAVARAVAPKPINVVVGFGSPPVAALAQAGVKRISLGGSLYRLAMGALAEAAQGMAEGSFDGLRAAIPSRNIAALLPG